MNILIGGLPPDVTEDSVRELVEAYSKVQAVELYDQGNPEQVAALVAIEDDSRAAARWIVKQLDGKYWQGRALDVGAPLFLSGS